MVQDLATSECKMFVLESKAIFKMTTAIENIVPNDHFNIDLFPSDHQTRKILYILVTKLA